MFKYIKLFLLIFFLCNFVWISQSESAIIIASSCSSSDVQSAINSASDGDTILVPIGNCTWTNGVAWSNKGIIIKGEGIDQTVITMGSETNDAFYITGSSNNLRISGFTFDGNSHGGNIKIKGDHHDFRIDHCKFTHICCDSTNRPIQIGEGYCDGVIDRNEFINNNARSDILVYGDGDDDWDRPIVLGGSDGVVFVEDNTFTCNDLTLSYPEHVMSCGNGGRYVFRYNTIDIAYGGSLHMGAIDAHGYCFYGRSTVSYEIYSNIIKSDHSYRGMFIRGGTGVIYNNTFIGEFVEKIHLTNYRSMQECTGFNVSPSTCEEGYPCKDQINNLYIWNNKLGENDIIATVVSSGSVPDHIQEGRDYFHYEKPDYTPYQYPHPLTQDSVVVELPGAPIDLHSVSHHTPGKAGGM